MPYIKQEKRDKYDPLLSALLERMSVEGWEPGDLNYCYTQLARGYWNANQRYKTIATVSGVLHDVGAEFDRQVTAKFEDGKIQENGGIYL